MASGQSGRRRNNQEWNYAVLYGGRLVGGVGIKINQHRPHIGEIGYFLDEAYWGRGITTRAVRLAEKEGFRKLGLRRIEIIMQPENLASERVAVKCGYQKEGLLRQVVRNKRTGQFRDCWLYAKVLAKK